MIKRQWNPKTSSVVLISLSIKETALSSYMYRLLYHNHIRMYPVKQISRSFQSLLRYVIPNITGISSLDNCFVSSPIHHENRFKTRLSVLQNYNKMLFIYAKSEEYVIK